MAPMSPMSMSPMSPMSSSMSMSITPLSLDSDFNTMSLTFELASQHPWTPRSIEAQRMLGVLPHELALQPIEHFYSPGLSVDLIKLRYQAHEQARHEIIERVQKQRQLLIDAQWSPNAPATWKLKMQAQALALAESTQNSTAATLSPSTSMKQLQMMMNKNEKNTPKKMDKSASTSVLPLSLPLPFISMGTHRKTPQQQMIKSKMSKSQPNLLPMENKIATPTSTTPTTSITSTNKNTWLKMEEEKLKKIVQRQNKEVEQMLASELKIAQKRHLAEEKMKQMRERERELEQVRKVEAQRAAEKKRLLELAKAEEFEKERQRIEDAQQQMLEKELKNLAEIERAEAERKLDMRKRDEEMRRMKLHRARQLEEERRRWQECMKQKELELEHRDELRRQTIEQKKRMLQEEHAKKHAKAQQRVQTVLSANEQLLEKKKHQFQQKQAAQQQRMRTYEERKKSTMHEKAVRQAEQQRKRIEAMNEANSILENRVQSIVEKREKHDHLKAQIDKSNAEQLALKAELHRLNKAKKEANVQRLQRMHEYKRQMLLEKVEEDEQRTHELEQKKAQLMLTRQKNKIALARQKSALLDALSKISVTPAINNSFNATMSDNDGGQPLKIVSKIGQLQRIAKTKDRTLRKVIPKRSESNELSSDEYFTSFNMNRVRAQS